MGFIEDIIANDLESGVSDVDPSLKLKFLTLLCKLKPDLVQNALKAYTFPLTEALEICQKAKNLQGMAFIYTRTDKIDLALKIYIKVTSFHEIIHQGFERYIDPPASATANRKLKDLDLPKLLLENESTSQPVPDSALHLAEALFSYHNITQTLAREADYKNPKANEFFEMFMKYIFDLYEDLDKKDENISGLGQEKLSRYIELRRFIKSHIFDDYILLYVARVGAKYLVEVLDCSPVPKDQSEVSKTERLRRHLDPLSRTEKNHRLRPEYHLITVEILRQDTLQVKQLALETKQIARIFDPNCRGCGQEIHSTTLLDCRHPICLCCLAPEVIDSRTIRCHVCPTSEVVSRDFKRYCLEEKPIPSVRVLAQTSTQNQQKPLQRTRTDKDKLAIMLGFEDFSDSVSTVTQS